MVGYLKQIGHKNLRFSPPNSYRSFFGVFQEFQSTFNLDRYSNYDIDKYLWQYGKNLINDIATSNDVNLDKAKSILKKRITNKDRSRVARVAAT
mgnify:CR=1 FL=1